MSTEEMPYSLATSSAIRPIYKSSGFPSTGILSSLYLYCLTGMLRILYGSSSLLETLSISFLLDHFYNTDSQCY